MATLLDMLQTKLASTPPPPEAAPAQPNIEEIMAAKKGRQEAQPSAITGGSNVMGDVTQNLTKQALGAQAQEGQTQAAQLGQQAQASQQKLDLGQQQLNQNAQQFQQQQVGQAQMQRTEVAAQENMATQQRQATEDAKTKEIADKTTLAMQALASERGISRDNLFATARSDNKELMARKDAASLEQKAMMLALSDKGYVQEINRIGAERNLRDKAAFDQEARRVMFGNEFSKLMDGFAAQANINTKDRDARDVIAQLSNYQIIQLAETEAKQANMRAMYEGIGNLGATAGKFAIGQLTAPAAPAAPLERQGVDSTPAAPEGGMYG